MTEHTTVNADTPANHEPKAAGPVVDAHTGEAVPEPAPPESETQELIEPGAPPEPAESEPVAEARAETSEPAEHEPEAPAPMEASAESTEAPTEVEAPAETDEGDAGKPAKKARAPRAKVAPASAAEPTALDPVAADPSATPDTAVTPTEEPKPENKKKWYAIKVQSGREDTIKAAILRKVAIEGLEDSFGQIMIPFEEVIEKKSVKVKDKKTGEYTTQEKKVTRKKKKFQGYLFAELEFTDRILYLFRETSGVGDFLSLRGTPPVPEPMPEHEVTSMLTGVSTKPGGKPQKVKLEFEKGDRVRIKEGSFINQEGEIKEIILPKDPTDPPKVIVVATLWGRPLDVELEYWQVAKV